MRELTPGLERKNVSIRSLGSGGDHDPVVARKAEHLRPTRVAQPVQRLRHPRRDRRPAGAGVAGEAHVLARRLAGEPLLEAQAVDHSALEKRARIGRA